MHPELGQIGPIVIRTYTLLLDLAILIGLGMLAWQGKHIDDTPTRRLDSGLFALVGGIIGGRLEHVIVHSAYFIEHPAEIVQIWNGGIGWHGAVIVGLVFLALSHKVTRVRFVSLLGTLSLALPLGAMLTYAGCLMDRCGHGREVETLVGYPPLLVAELPDMYGMVTPRFASQLYGFVLGLLLLIVSIILARRVNRPGLRFWLVLALLGLGAFAIGFTRGDSNPMLGPLRLDQILDLVIVALGVAGSIQSMSQPIEGAGATGTARRFAAIRPGHDEW
jgi:phosphatidylglycerol:prolipoprotein diacylglycerol transferase